MLLGQRKPLTILPTGQLLKDYEGALSPTLKYHMLLAGFLNDWEVSLIISFFQ